MSKQIAKIPLTSIARIENYINTGKKPLAQVVAEKRAEYGGIVYGINWGLFNTAKFTPEPLLKKDGAMLTPIPWNCFGFGWDKGPDIKQDSDITKYPNYVSGVELITPWGAQKTISCPNAMRGRRGRTAWGFDDHDLTLFCTGDGTADALDEYALRDWGVASKLKAWLMGDSGGSSQCVLPNGSIYSARPVYHIILIYIKKDEEGADDMGKPAITQRYMTQNRCYTNPVRQTMTRLMLHSTATPGATKEAIAAAWDNASAGASVHYVADDKGVIQTLPINYRAWHADSPTTKGANDRYIAMEICEPVQTALLPINWISVTPTMTAAVKASPRMKYQVTQLQRELMRLGYDPKGVDGSYGPGCQAAVRAYQAANKLVADGFAGPATLASFQSRAGSLLRYQTADARAYFDKAYGYAVHLSAWLMGEIGGKASEIIDHAEGYKLGIASNHADVGHWFPQHGKNMDVFRADVAAAMGGAVAPDPFASAVDKLAAAGVITDTAYWKAGVYSAENVRTLIGNMAAML